MEILKTKDYDKFEFINGNRNVSEKKVQNIIEDIRQGLNLLPYCPILVFPKDGLLKIVDGQHRKEVSRRTGDYVYYLICEHLTLKQVAKMNSRGQKWSARNFLNCYVKLGVEDYIILDRLVTKFKTNISTTLSFLATFGLKDRQKWSRLFQEGEFKVHFEKETEELFTLSHSLFDKYIFYNDRYLIEAVRRIQEKGKCDFKRLKEKIDRYPMEMNKQSTSLDYIYNIERVYNKDSQKRLVIY